MTIKSKIDSSDGIITDTDENCNGKPFFRKIFYNSISPNINMLKAATVEYTIASILQKNPLPNIVTYYVITEKHIDMEELDIVSELDEIKVIDILKNVKDFLQNLGVMYIDWKKDNIGISADGTYKLFDFDVSGVINLQTKEWIIKPLEYWSYNRAIKMGCTTPQQIDDCSFTAL